jgi:hypothetical protein
VAKPDTLLLFGIGDTVFELDPAPAGIPNTDDESTSS